MNWTRMNKMLGGGGLGNPERMNRGEAEASNRVSDPDQTSQKDRIWILKKSTYSKLPHNVYILF
jgi:hypothetical protein